MGNHLCVRFGNGLRGRLPVLLSIVGLCLAQTTQAVTLRVWNDGSNSLGVQVRIYDSLSSAWVINNFTIPAGLSHDYVEAGINSGRVPTQQVQVSTNLGSTYLTTGLTFTNATQVLEWWMSGTTPPWKFPIRVVNNKAYDVLVGMTVGTDPWDPDVVESGGSSSFVLSPYGNNTDNIVVYEQGAGLSYDPVTRTVSQILASNTLAVIASPNSYWTQLAVPVTYYVLTLGTSGYTDNNPLGTNGLASTGVTPGGTNQPTTGTGQVNSYGAVTNGGGPPNMLSMASGFGGIIDAINAAARGAHSDALLAVQEAQAINANTRAATNLLSEGNGIGRAGTNLLGSVTNLLAIGNELQRTHTNLTGTGLGLLRNATNYLETITNQLAVLINTNSPFGTNVMGLTNGIASPLNEAGEFREGSLSKFVNWDVGIGGNPFPNVELTSGAISVYAETNPFLNPTIASGAVGARKIASFFLVLGFFAWAVYLIWDEIAKGLRTPQATSSAGGAVPFLGSVFSIATGVGVVVVASVGLSLLFVFLFQVSGLDELLTGPWAGLGGALWIADQVFPVVLASSLLFSGLVLVTTAGFWKVTIAYVIKAVAP